MTNTPARLLLCPIVLVALAACPTRVDEPDADAGAPGADAGSTVDDDPDAGPDDTTTDAGVPDVTDGSRALRTSGAQLVRIDDGAAVEVRGAISCCGGGFGWPLFDESWSDLVASHGGNFLHARLGPFLTSGNGEVDWAAIGGGYEEVDGLADLDRFNDVFWGRVRALLQHARDQGQYVEVDVVDGWALKHCQAGDIPGYSAWDAAFNVQGIDACSGAGAGAVVPGSVHERWIKKLVDETGAFDNVLYQDGNEIGLVGGYSPEWTASIAALIRQQEAAHGYVRHLLSTNSGVPEAMQLAEVDYVEAHQQRALGAAECFGKPCMVNEYNPSPALSAEEFQQRLCSARAQGTVFWYWRHSQTEAQMLDSLALLNDACPSSGATSFPQGVPEEGFIAAATSNADTDPAVDAAVNAAMTALTGCNPSSTCDISAFAGATAEEKCQSWFAAVNAELRSAGLSAGQHEEGHTDEIAVSNTGCTGRWYGYHVCNYGGPLVVWTPGARRGWWMIDPSYCE